MRSSTFSLAEAIQSDAATLFGCLSPAGGRRASPPSPTFQESGSRSVVVGEGWLPLVYCPENFCRQCLKVRQSEGSSDPPSLWADGGDLLSCILFVERGLLHRTLPCPGAAALPCGVSLSTTHCRGRLPLLCSWGSGGTSWLPRLFAF